jgi:hypothetical protein
VIQHQFEKCTQKIQVLLSYDNSDTLLVVTKVYIHRVLTGSLCYKKKGITNKGKGHDSSLLPDDPLSRIPLPTLSHTFTVKKEKANLDPPAGTSRILSIYQERKKTRPNEPRLRCCSAGSVFSSCISKTKTLKGIWMFFFCWKISWNHRRAVIFC